MEKILINEVPELIDLSNEIIEVEDIEVVEVEEKKEEPEVIEIEEPIPERIIEKETIIKEKPWKPWKDGKTPTKTELKKLIKEVFPEDKLLQKLIDRLPVQEVESIEIGEDQWGQWISKNDKKMYIKRVSNIGAGMSTWVVYFLGLLDAPDSYVWQGGKVVKVKGDETGLEFSAEGGGGQVNSIVAGTNISVDSTDQANPIVTNTQDISGKANTADLGAVAFSNDYDDLDNKPTISSGTVTSVAVTGSDGIEVDSGSPVTTTGTIALGVNKTSMLSHLNVEDGADVTDATNVNAAGAVMNSDYTPAHSILVQQSGTGSPTALQIGNNTLVGRIAGGGSNIDDLSASQVRTLINVENGAEVNNI